MSQFTRKSKINLLIIIYFVILSFLLFFPLSNSHFIYYGDDIQFHLNRIEEIYHNFQNHNLFAFISTFNFNKVGIAENVFYPNLFLSLFAVLRLFFVPVTAIYLGVGIFNLLTFLLAYYSYYSFSKSTIKSFIFANVYGLSLFRYIEFLKRFDLGEFIGLTFLPLALLAFYKVTFENDGKYWKWLALAMACILYSHLITLVIVTTFFFIIFLVFSFRLKLKFVIKQYLFAVGLFLLLGAGFFVNFLKMTMMGPIRKPVVVDLSRQALQTADLFNASLDNNVLGVTNLGIIAVIILILVILNYFRLSKMMRNVFWISIVTIAMTTKLFPWGYFPAQFSLAVQMPWRLLMIANLLVAVLAAEVLATFNVKTVLLIGMPLLFILSASTVQNYKVNRQRTKVLLQKDVKPFYLNRHKKLYTNQSYYYVTSGNRYRDYAPWPKELTTRQKDKNYARIAKHLYRDGKKFKKIRKLKSLPNGIIMKFTMSKNVNHESLPFYLYNAKNYQVSVNGQRVKPHYDRYHNLVTKVRKGKNTVQIKFIPSFIQIASIWLSVVTFFALVIFWCKSKWEKRN